MEPRLVEATTLGLFPKPRLPRRIAKQRAKGRHKVRRDEVGEYARRNGGKVVPELRDLGAGGVCALSKVQILRQHGASDGRDFLRSSALGGGIKRSAKRAEPPLAEFPVCGR